MLFVAMNFLFSAQENKAKRVSKVSENWGLATMLTTEDSVQSVTVTLCPNSFNTALNKISRSLCKMERPGNEKKKSFTTPCLCLPKV